MTIVFDSHDGGNLFFTFRLKHLKET